MPASLIIGTGIGLLTPAPRETPVDPNALKNTDSGLVLNTDGAVIVGA